MTEQEIKNSALYQACEYSVRLVLATNPQNGEDDIMRIIMPLIKESLDVQRRINKMMAVSAAPIIINNDMELVAKWLEKNATRFVELEYNEFHRELDYQGYDVKGLVNEFRTKFIKKVIWNRKNRNQSLT